MELIRLCLSDRENEENTKNFLVEVEKREKWSRTSKLGRWCRLPHWNLLGEKRSTVKWEMHLARRTDSAATALLPSMELKGRSKRDTWPKPSASWTSRKTPTDRLLCGEFGLLIQFYSVLLFSDTEFNITEFRFQELRSPNGTRTRSGYQVRITCASSPMAPLVSCRVARHDSHANVA